MPLWKTACIAEVKVGKGKAEMRDPGKCCRSLTIVTQVLNSYQCGYVSVQSMVWTPFPAHSAYKSGLLGLSNVVLARSLVN